MRDVGRRFRLGKLENKKVIVVMTGLSMVTMKRDVNHILFSHFVSNPSKTCSFFFFFGMKLNAGITTQLLVTLFNVEGVLHYGVAGNANPNLGIGDVTIPRYWAHSGLWNWQVKINFFTLIY